MRGDWDPMGTSSPEMFVELDRSRPRGLRAQVEHGLREAIRSGRLSPGTRLPSSRALADDLGLSRGLVVAVYEQLTAEGYLTSRQGSGTIVSTKIVPAAPQRPAVPVGAKRIYSFTPAHPDLSLFPAWLGLGLSGLRGARCPTMPSATAIRSVCRRCAKRWPTTWGACAAWRASRSRS